jgi:hypothetical protein
VATCNGKLAVALEATPNKQDLESSRFDTANYTVIKEIIVALYLIWLLFHLMEIYHVSE